MNSWQNMSYASRFAGDAYDFLLPRNFSFETSVANEVSDSTADKVLSSQDGLMSADLLISFFDCVPVPQGPQISVLSDLSDWSDKSDRHSRDFSAAGYTIIDRAVRTFRGWLTVTAESVILNVVRAFRRTCFAVNALFNRRTFVRVGGLRL